MHIDILSANELHQVRELLEERRFRRLFEGPDGKGFLTFDEFVMYAKSGAIPGLPPIGK